MCCVRNKAVHVFVIDALLSANKAVQLPAQFILRLFTVLIIEFERNPDTSKTPFPCIVVGDKSYDALLQ